MPFRAPRPSLILASPATDVCGLALIAGASGRCPATRTRSLAYIRPISSGCVPMCRWVVTSAVDSIHAPRWVSRRGIPTRRSRRSRSHSIRPPTTKATSPARWRREPARISSPFRSGNPTSRTTSRTRSSFSAARCATLAIRSSIPAKTRRNLWRLHPFSDRHASAQHARPGPCRGPVPASTTPDRQCRLARDTQSRRKTGSLDSVERLLGFVPSCMKVFDAQGQQRLSLFAADFKGRFAAGTARVSFSTDSTCPPCWRVATR